MKKRLLQILVLIVCCTFFFFLGRYNNKNKIDFQKSEVVNKDSVGYVLIHTSDGECLGYYGKIDSFDDENKNAIELEITGWLVGRTEEEKE